MNKFGLLAVSFLVLVGMATATPAFAVTMVGSADTFTYNFSLPAFTNVNGDSGSPSQFSITFTNGAFGQPGSISGDFTPTGSPLANGGFYSVGWTTGSTLPGGNNDLTEMMIEYSTGSYPETNVDVLSFAFLEPTAFWATAGTDLSFNNGAADSAYGWLYYYNDSPTAHTSLWGNTNTGASYSTWTNGVQTDPPCVGCTVTITDTPIPTATPEPSSLLLLGSGLVGLAGMVRRKIGARI